MTLTTGLLLVLFTQLDSLGDGFLVANLRTTLVSLYTELSLKTVNDDIKMKLTHT